MSDQYSYQGDNSIIIQDGSIIWNDQSHDQSSLQYMDANDTIVDESYVTATDSNETQYFSILEQSNDITLEDIHNLTIGNSDSQENIVFTEDISPNVEPESEQENTNDDKEESQVVVFTVDGSDDLYGLQLTQDEEGNIQKYQFKFRASSDGQLEAIPETIQLLSSDDQTEATSNEQPEVEQSEETLQSETYFLVQSRADSENMNDNLDHENEDGTSENDGTTKRVMVKGERQSPVIFEENIENDDFTQESHNCLKIECVNIKSEIRDRAYQVDNVETCELSEVNIKQEYLTQEVDQYEESDLGVDQAEETLGLQEDVYEEIEQEEPEQYTDAENIYNQNEVTISHQLQLSEDMVDEVIHSEEIEIENSLDQDELVQQFMNKNHTVEVEYDTVSQDQDGSSKEYQLGDIYDVQENQKRYVNNYMVKTTTANSDTDEQYEIVEGLHVTGETDKDCLEQCEKTTEPVLHEVIETYQEQQAIERTNILKHPAANTDKEPKSKKTMVSVKYYVVYPEKENVNSLVDNTASQLPVPKLTRPNPRSVLRTSFMKPKPAIEKHKPVPTNTVAECDLFHKRFAKNKEAMRAKLFHNFLNRTTIPHAPIRQHRQPRKQEIKPVLERGEEEIIVQEVIVSSNGFVESINKKVKDRNFQVTAVVELSDSEDDSNSKTRKSHQIPIQQSDSEVSIIEIYSDEEIDSTNKGIASIISQKHKELLKKSDVGSQSTVLKRRRGRPPKIKKNNKTDQVLSPSKRNRILGEGIKTNKSEITIEKQEISCPKCPKTFPSQNSLNTHIIHHNLENSLKNKAKMNSRPSLIPRQSLLPKVEYSHKCENCQQTFKNNLLLQRHKCTNKQVTLNCSVCLKQFKDVVMLNIHKKTHIKSNLVSSTSGAKVSPRKSFMRPSTSLMRSPKIKPFKKPSTNSFKCKQCPKMCVSEHTLTEHTKMHKKFLCSSCPATFSSKFLLDTHIMTNCVKMRSSPNRRLSFKIRKSFVHTPPRRQSISKPIKKSLNPGLNTTLNQSITSLKLECEICKMKFLTFRTLYTHKVQDHGMSTPDKSLINKPKKGLYKPVAAHGGIPANERMKKAYAALRQKLAEMQNESNNVQ